jgi:hypothetical protein
MCDERLPVKPQLSPCRGQLFQNPMQIKKRLAQGKAFLLIFH